MASTPSPPNNTQWAHSIFQASPMMLPPVRPNVIGSISPSTNHASPIGATPGDKDSRTSGYMSGIGYQGPLCQAGPGETGAGMSARKLAVSRLAFPFNARRKALPPGPPTSASPIAKRSPEPPTCRKHTCAPSPLGRVSEAPLQAPPAAPLGLMFKPKPRYHGYSRHSLLLTKWVWSTRQAQFEAMLKDLTEEARAVSQAGLPWLLTSHPNYLRIRRMRSFFSEEKISEQPVMIYPRQGDIAALRDPYCARVDRSFAAVPVWTLSKVICLFAILVPKPREEDVFEDAGSEASFDAESTLVDSDSEWDTSTTCSSRQDDDIIDCEVKGDLLSRAVHRANFGSDLSTSHMASTVWLVKFYSRPSFNVARNQTWPSTWDARWDLLIGLARRDAVPVDKALELKVRPPKEFRWLKLLGSSKVPKALAVVPGEAVHGLSGAPRSTFLTPSHPAAG